MCVAYTAQLHGSVPFTLPFQTVLKRDGPVVKEPVWHGSVQFELGSVAFTLVK